MNGTFMSGAPPAAQVSGQHGTGKSAAATGGLPATQAGRPGKDGPVQTFHLLLAEQMPEKAGRTHDAKTAPKKKPLSAGDRENKEGNPGAPLLIPAAPGGERALAHPSAVRLSGGGVVDVGEIRATGEPAPEGTGFGSGDTAGRRVFSPRRPGAGSVPTEGKWRSEATADLAPRDVEISFPGTDADARGRQVPAHVLGESGDQPGGSGSAGHAGRRPEFADAAGPAPESQAGGNSVQNTPVSAVDARVIRRDPPAVTALTALGGQVFEQEGTSPGIQGVPPADRRRNDPRGMTAGPGVSGTWFQTSPPGQAMQEPPAVLTNVPNEQVGNAVVANLAQRTWRPGESVTLRVTVVPADLGPVQVVAHMDSSGQLHVQIHTASLETQSLIQQQSAQLMGHLQQNHIPVHRLDVTNDPSLGGSSGQSGMFQGGTGSWQDQGRSPLYSSIGGSGGAGMSPDISGDGPSQAVYGAAAASRAYGSANFEAVV